MVATSTLTTPAGEVFVTGRGYATITAPALNSCEAVYGLYIDGTAVSGSRTELNSGGLLGGTVADNISINAVATVTAGSHTITLRRGVGSGNCSTNTTQDGQVSVLAIDN